MTITQIVDEIDRATEPEKMGKRQALTFLEQLSTEIDCRIDGLKDDLKSEDD